MTELEKKALMAAVDSLFDYSTVVDMHHGVAHALSKK